MLFSLLRGVATFHSLWCFVVKMPLPGPTVYWLTGTGRKVPCKTSRELEETGNKKKCQRILKGTDDAIYLFQRHLAFLLNSAVSKKELFREHEFTNKISRH